MFRQKKEKEKEKETKTGKLDAIIYIINVL
jgi:hypothetical protein